VKYLVSQALGGLNIVLVLSDISLAIPQCFLRFIADLGDLLSHVLLRCELRRRVC
jgi:hypothetical protein